MHMTQHINPFFAEAARAASLVLAHAWVNGERRTDEIQALVERSAA